MLFKTTNVNKAEWLSLVFENRNQSYGAYVLRKESGNYLLKALLLAVLMLSSVIIFSSFSWEEGLECATTSSVVVHQYRGREKVH